MILREVVDLELHPSPDYLSDEVRRTGDFYEPHILDEIRYRLAGPPGVLVDVGAMIGNHTTYLAAFVPHTAIHAFEPSPLNRELLTANVAAFATVTAYAVALSDRPGTLPMASMRGNRGHALVNPSSDAADSVEARWWAATFTLDSFRLEDVRLIKVDVEGHEPPVIAGALETIRRSHPLIVIEDWPNAYGPMMAALGYRLGASWRDSQTDMYAWAG